MRLPDARRLHSEDRKQAFHRGIDFVETVYDWVTILGFAGLVTLFLQRSSLENPPDTIWHYLPPSIGAAACNYFGNEEQHAVAIAIGVATIAYVFLVLKPRLRT